MVYGCERWLVRKGERVELVAPPQNEALALLVGIAQITDAGLVYAVKIDSEALHIPQDEEMTVQGVYVDGRFNKVTEQIYFQGEIGGVFTAPCSRCLEIARTDFIIETRVVFLPAASDRSGEENRLHSSDDIDLYFHDGVILDLRPLVREQIVLAFPVQTLCREDCAGLCQVCGTNRNMEPCTCQTEAGDSRFAILQRLRLP
jgi:uncharacterized protein